MTGYLSCPLGINYISRIDPAQEKKVVELTCKVSSFWTMLATKSQKAAEDSQNKEKN